MPSRSSTVGAYLMPFSRIGGHMTFPPALLTHVQTDGSWGYRHGARVAAVVTAANSKNRWQDMIKVDAVNSTETEWASVLFGLTLAVNNRQEAIGIENDNLSVIHGLMFPKNRLRLDYAAYYRNEIQKVAATTVWTGVRWIPRERNSADDLFRLA